MGINRLILSSGHSNSHNNYMGGNAFEALVGAIYLDRGYDMCMRFMQKRILDITNLEEIADNAAKEAKKYGVTLKVGKCVKPPYEAVYKRELDEALSYIAFTMKPDAGTIEIYDIEEILYQCLIKHIHYSYYSICEFAVLLAVDGTVTNQKVEDMKQELIKTSWKYRRPPYHFDK